MSKQHPHVPSGEHSFTFIHEFRNNPGAWMVVEKEKRFELGPWFYFEDTAKEMAAKATRRDQFCNAIPCVPYGTEIPRPEGSWFRPQEYGGKDVTIK